MNGKVNVAKEARGGMKGSSRDVERRVDEVHMDIDSHLKNRVVHA